jgi:uncharacterized membrane protein
MSLA